MKPFVIAASLLFAAVLVVPSLLVQFVPNGQSEERSAKTAAEVIAPSDEIIVPVFRGKTETIEEVPLEQYVVGVVASEMPADFEIEALKAQALTARTYIVKQMLEKNSDFKLPDGAIITDSKQHQVYHNKDELKQRWGKDYDWKIARIEEAVYQTAGQVLTYEGEPITAAFFSTSNGYTENSEDYWENEIPYLRSVESPWDERSPRFTSQKTIPIHEFESRLGVDISKIDDLQKTIVERTEGRRVRRVVFPEKEFTGREIRDLLELDSSDFRWRKVGDQIVIDTKGWGHGVGMSQYGADGMAKEGKSYVDIVRYYYQGVDIQTVDPYVNRLTVKR